MQANRICKTCGKKYFYCSHCDKSKGSPEWMLMWDTENCKTIFEIVSSYIQGQINKASAKERLDKCDLKQLYSFKENIRKIIEEIIEEEKKVVEEDKKVEQPKQRNIPKRNRQKRN